MDLREAAHQFLQEKRVAIVGVSREPTETANAIFARFRAQGYEVFPVNPAAQEVEGVPCYARVQDIPGGVGAAMLVTTPAASAVVARDCVAAGVRWVWMHRSIGDSVSEEAVIYLRQNQVNVIPGACPMMFLAPDGAHKAMCWLMQAVGRIPRQVPV